MQPSLVLTFFDSRSRHAGTFLCAILFLFASLCMGTALAQRPVDTATHDYYPWALDSQLRRIAESSADEVQLLREVCATILNDLNAVVVHLEHTPLEPCPEIQRLEELYSVLETLRKSWAVTHSIDEPCIPSATALDEMSLALQRRIYVWRALFNAEVADVSPVTTLFGKCFADINRLKERTLAVEHYFTKSGRTVDNKTGLTWCDYLETRSWISELEACQQPIAQPVRLVSFSSPSIPVDALKMLSTRANATIRLLESPTLTQEQRVFLNHPTVNTWKDELQSWTADVVAPIHILRLLERYETNGGMSDMKALSSFIDMLSASKTTEYRQLGDYVRQQYGMANVRLFLSNALLNNHLPPTVSEIAPFRDVILSQPTVGRRQTDAEMEVSFLPHPTRVLTAIDVGIDLATFSRTDAFATQLFNTGRTLVIARKKIELTEKGFLTEPCEVLIVGHRTQLRGMDTNFDGVPVVGKVFRGVVRNQYVSKAQEANTETQRKIKRQVRNKIDGEVEQRLKPINEQLQKLFQFANDEFGLHLERRDSRTDENWLISAWDIRGNHTLSSNTPTPETLPGSYADLKIHESLPNMLLGRLKFEGKRGTVREFKEALAAKFNLPDLATPEENDHVEITFAPYNPVVVRFVDGRVELTISIAALRLLGKTHRNFQVIVRYKPAYDSEGRPVLKRDGYMSLIGVREQFILRTAFGKIFPESRPLPLVPKILENDPQYEYLTTGHCRIEKGWIALALVEKPEMTE